MERLRWALESRLVERGMGNLWVWRGDLSEGLVHSLGRFINQSDRFPLYLWREDTPDIQSHRKSSW